MNSRAKKLIELRRNKKIAETISIICGFTAVFLMGGVDSPNWIMVLLTMFLFIGMAFIAGIVAQEYDYRIKRVIGGEIWRRGIWR